MRLFPNPARAMRRVSPFPYTSRLTSTHEGKWDNILSRANMEASFMECDAPDKGINSPRNPPRRGICLSTQTSRIYIILLLVLHFSNLHFYSLLSRCRSLKSLPSLLLLLSVPSPHHQPFSRYFMVVHIFLGSSNSGFSFVVIT